MMEEKTTLKQDQVIKTTPDLSFKNQEILRKEAI